MESTDLDLSGVPAGIYRAACGDMMLTIEIRRPGPRSKNHGWIFVFDGEFAGHRKGYRAIDYGRQAPGGLYEGWAVEALRTIASDPKATAVTVAGK